MSHRSFETQNENMNMQRMIYAKLNGMQSPSRGFKYRFGRSHLVVVMAYSNQIKNCLVQI